MPDESQDIFGKIDAILGKRVGFAGGQPVASDEFPMLTEIVEAVDAVKAPSVRAEDAMTATASGPAGAQPAAVDAGLNDLELDRLAAALEARLSELFIRQQMRIETLVRQVVREELLRQMGGHLGGQPGGHPGGEGAPPARL